jgi:hypothetical protein
MAQRVDGHPPSDNSDKMHLREARTGENDEIRMTNVEGITKMQSCGVARPICHPNFIRHLSLAISFTSLPIGDIAGAWG